MSRAIVFDLDNFAAGEIKGNINRGWSLAGVAPNSGGGSVQLVLPIAAASEGWLQFGRMIYVDHPQLGPWVGVLDTPWKATAPIQVTAYDPAYLLALRVQDKPITLTGDVVGIISQLIDMINAQEEMYLRLGNTSGLSSVQLTKKIDQKPIWGQLNAFGIETGTEIIVRPERVNQRLTLYVDLSAKFGADVSFLLYDGEKGNMRIVAASVEGSIRNRIIGITSANSAASRLQAGPYLDSDSVGIYRLRSWVEQFRDVKEQGILQAGAQQYLTNNAWPRLRLTAEIYEAAFPLLALGNRIPVQASKVYLPGGRHGWSGEMRLYAMAYNESQNVVTVSMEALL